MDFNVDFDAWSVSRDASCWLFVGLLGPDKRLIEADFSTREARQDMLVRREILWESESASSAEVLRKEREFIIALRTNDPTVGYNRSPKWTNKL